MTYILDCTLRDGGYYNDWDFEDALIKDYLVAMESLRIDFVEIGFRSLKNDGFKGGVAYSTDNFIEGLDIPKFLEDKIGVMVNGAEIACLENQEANLNKLFKKKKDSPVTLVRIACHTHEFKSCLPAANWLKEKGYIVGFNLMQIADRSLDEISELAKLAQNYPIDILYFADSVGSLNPSQVNRIIEALQHGWKGALGIHTHDNMGLAVANSVQAVKSGATWIDSTVTGMGRGPGNAQTEYITLALLEYRKNKGNPTKLFELIQQYFKPMKSFYGWGTNPFYYLAGMYGIHPSYIQEMIQDSRYSEEDILSVIDYLKVEGGKKFSFVALEAAREFFSNSPCGKWKPSTLLNNRTVLILGSGPGVKKYRKAIEKYIEDNKPYVIALNTQSNISQELIDARAACHPVRLLADYQEHLKLPQPLITPESMLPNDVRVNLEQKCLLDFGIVVAKDTFSFYENYCKLPKSLVIAYALAIASSGGAEEVLLAGFDGYGADDPRRKEMDHIFSIYEKNKDSIPFASITPTRYEIPVKSIYGLSQ